MSKENQPDTFDQAIEKEIKKYQKYDVFAGKIPININKFEAISSKEGTVFTLIFYILLFLFFIFNSPGDIIWRQFPSVSQSSINQENAFNVNFTIPDPHENIGPQFFFFVNIFDLQNKPFEDETYIKVKLKIYTNLANKTNSEKDFDEYKLNSCKEENQENQESQQKSNIDLIKGDSAKKKILKKKIKENFKCPNFTGFEVLGSANDDIEKYGQIAIYPCDGKDSNNNPIKCKTEKEISDKIDEKKLKIKLIYPAPIIKTDNIKNGEYIKKWIKI